MYARITARHAYGREGDQGRVNQVEVDCVVVIATTKKINYFFRKQTFEKRNEI
jgi:hypothetical protein